MLIDTAADPTADSYVSLEAFKGYAQNMGWCLGGESEVAVALRRAAMALDTLYAPQGSRTIDTQALSWPRMGIVVDGQSIAPDAIPKAVKDAQSEMAHLILKGFDPFKPTSAQRIKRKKEKVDVLEEETEFEATGQEQSFPVIDRLLSGYAARIETSGNGTTEGRHTIGSVPLLRV